jgi:hypothetical protein
MQAFRQLRLGTLLARRLHIRRELADDEHAVPVQATFEVERDYVLPSDFKVSRFKGLVSCEVLQQGSVPMSLVTCWRSRMFLETQTHTFRKASGAGALVQAVEVGQTILRARSWRPTSVWDAITKLTAIAGAYTFAQAFYVSVLAPPSIELLTGSITSPQVVNVPFKVPLIVTNQNAVASERIKVVGGTMTGVVGSVDVTGETLTIEPGKRMDLSLDARATSAGTAAIRIAATVRGGYWRTQPRNVTLNVEVWPQRAKTAFHTTPGCRPGACIVAAEYTFGKTSGIQECMASVSVDDDTAFEAVRNYGGDPPLRSAAPVVTRIEWRMPDIVAPTKRVVQMALTGSRGSAEWEALAPRIEWDCRSVRDRQ